MRLPLRRIHLSDTDATGFAYSARLVDLAVQRLEEALAAGGLAGPGLVGAAACPVVARLESDFHRPVSLGESLGATVVCRKIGVSSATFSILLGPARRPACSVGVVLVWIDRAAGAGVPWPPALRRKLARC